MSPETHSSSTRRPHRRHRERASKLDLAILWGGLVAAAISGVIAYRIVGLYGDGPFSYGYHRTTDPETGKSLLVHESYTKEGRLIRRVIDDRTLKAVEMDVDAGGGKKEHITAEVDSDRRIRRVDRDTDHDGKIDRWEYYDENQKLVKVGFSLRNDGVLDAWAYRDGNGQVTKVEVSTRRDETIDRWEYYEHGRLARVELDTNHDGKVDQWQTYEDGILMNTSNTPPSPRR